MIRCMGCMAEMPDNTGVCPYCGYTRGTPPREAYHLAPESILAGRYIVGRVLGFGGFGVTYIGYDAQLDRIVAIKEFLPTTFATRLPGGTSISVYEGAASQQYGFGLERFVQEAQRLAQFNGVPGITDIYDTFSGNNTAYIVMQYLKGQDVKNVLSTQGAMPYERARDIVLWVCTTLSAVHARGIIHRDISPDNIFLTDDGEVKLLDFGAARYESSVNSKSLSVILKAGYAPEEQYRSRGDQGPWTDIYALAATFYKMLTGVTPPDSMERAIKDELKEPSKMGANMPQSAENALLNALNIRKSDRTQSVEAFKNALQTDGVERVKVKARRADTGRVPTVAKVAMGLAGVLLVAFVALSATGVVNLGSAVLQGDFGSPVAEGNALVPGLTGKTRAEAQKLLEDAGLVMEEGRPQFSDSAARDTVLRQDPLPGRQLTEGAAVTVGVCAGTLEDAMAEGVIPNLVGMDAVQSTGFIASLAQEEDSGYYYARYSYEYSDTVPVGTVVRFKRTPGQNDIEVYVSAGTNDATPPYGQPRAPLISGQGNLHLTVAAASASVRAADAQEEESDYTGWRISVSADGGGWEELYTSSSSYYQSDEDVARGAPPSIDAYIDTKLLAGYAQYAGKTLRFRAEQFGLNRDENGGYSSMDETTHLATVDFSQSVRLELAENAVQVETVEALTWEDVAALVADGTLSQNDGLVQRMNELEESQREYYTPMRLTGNFEANRQYRVGHRTNGDIQIDYANAQQSGVLYVEKSLGSSPGLVSLFVFKEFKTAFSEDGSQITFTMDAPAECELNPFEAVVPVRGLAPNEAARLLLAQAADPYMQIRYAASTTVPAGQVIAWSGYFYEDEDKYSSIELFVSAGPPGDEPALVLGPTQRLEDNKYAYVSVGAYLGAYQELYLYYEYSTDSGASWEGWGSQSVWGDEQDSGRLAVFNETTTMSVPSDVVADGVRARLRLTDGEEGPTVQELEFDMPLAADAPLSY